MALQNGHCDVHGNERLFGDTSACPEGVRSGWSSRSKHHHVQPASGQPSATTSAEPRAKVNGKWQEWILMLGAKERSATATVLNLTGVEFEDLKKTARRFKQAVAQQRYHRKMALSSGKSYGKRGRPALGTTPMGNPTVAPVAARSRTIVRNKHAASPCPTTVALAGVLSASDQEGSRIPGKRSSRNEQYHRQLQGASGYSPPDVGPMHGSNRRTGRSAKSR